MRLYVLSNSVWHADDYLNQRNCNPMCTDLYLFETSEQAEDKAMSTDADEDIYNDGTIYTAEIEESTILELSGYETIDEFKEALAEPYSTKPRVKSYGYDEKTSVAEYIRDNADDEYPVDCANYNFDASLDGAILVCWAWQTYVGYARKCEGLRYASSDDTEAILTKEDRCYRTMCDVVMTADEVKACADIKIALQEKLNDASWKWTNPVHVNALIDEL